MVGQEELYAMALVTDEDCVSLYFAANTLEKVKEKDLKYAEMIKARLKEEEIKAVKDGTKSFVKWVPDEWAYSIGKYSPFTEISKMLLKQDERNAEEYAKSKPMFFECLTAAMKKLQKKIMHTTDLATSRILSRCVMVTGLKVSKIFLQNR